ncbi:ABC transporter substrate-binding protein [Nonomuraea jabiensis]|uniref:Peptide/nickel transport system substrate-binding protein n=1 Tax=Nonomuraea jabiensis TaxID=882448 RepID=A0A7W9LGT6_9ACTN|nr:ABC transporter substrate-binding protein [Nonomuraea jabiensis]MBB5783235.1 peptide/nickel transport system substrate-binding protein [Nonomuraea jabiensis]
MREFPRPFNRPALPGATDLTRRVLLAGTGGGALSLLLAACGAGGGAPLTGADSGAPQAGTGASAAASVPPRRGGTLRAGSPPPPTAVDPVTMYDGSAIAIVQLVADYLIWLDRDFTLKPRLAEKWESEDGGKRWAFTLRKGVTFSDGTPLDAEIVKASFDRLLDPKSKSAALSAFDTVLAKGGVSVRDAATVVFTLERTFSDFPYLVSAGNYNAVILKKDYAGDFTKKPIGTGPFLLESYDASSGATFTRNPKYWEPGKPYLDGVKITFYADDQADLLALQSGEIDAQILSRPQLVGPLKGLGDITVDQVQGTGLTAFTLRTDRPPFDRKEARQAVAYALDRPGVNATVYDGIGALGNDHLFAPLFPAAPDGIAQRAKDPAKVAELLGGQPLKFTLTYDPPSKDYALTVQNQLKQAGIQVELDQRTSADFYGGDQEKDTPWLFSTANLVGWAGRATPSQFIIPMVKGGGVWNGSKYANPDVDAAADAYDAAQTPEERATQAEIIAKALHEDVPLIVSVWSGTVRAYNGRKFTGIQAHPSSYVDFSSVSQVV